MEELTILEANITACTTLDELEKVRVDIFGKRNFGESICQTGYTWRRR